MSASHSKTPTKFDKGSILIVDDSPFILRMVRAVLSRLDLHSTVASDGFSAISQLQNNEFSIVITDINMPKMDGIELLKHIKEHFSLIDVIVMTSDNKKYTYTDVINAGATDFIEKPFSRDELSAKVNRIFRERKNFLKLAGEISSHQKTAQQLQTAKEAAEKANMAKSSFLNTVSHELRTPMNGIIGFADLLGETDLSTKQRAYLDNVTKSATILMELITKLLDFAKIDSGNIGLNKKVFPLANIFEELLALYGPKAKKAGISLKFTIEDAVPPQLFGDPKIFYQILVNLIDNALKFTQEGSVIITVTVKEQIDANNIVLQTAVTDTGCGLSANKREEIFEPFSQLENYSTRTHGGAGMGLAVCTRLVSLLRGNIWLESAEKIGSTFYFTTRFGIH